MKLDETKTKDETKMFKPESKIILTDCDGVLLNWQYAFMDWMKANDYVAGSVMEYDISKVYGIDPEQGKTLVKEFNQSAYIGYLPAMRDARSGVARLVEAGYRFHCITSLSTDEMAKRQRWMNLNQTFGHNVFVGLECLDTGADKDEALEPYRDTGLWWIEDKSENAVLGADLGLRSIVINQPHNANLQDERLARFDTWAGIVSHIIEGDK